MTRARKAGIGKLLLFSFVNAKTKHGCGSRKTLQRPWDPAYNLFNTLATLFFHFDADQNTSSTLNLTGLLALRRLLALTSCGQKKKGCRINFQFAKTTSPKSSALPLGWQVSILVSFFSHRINNLEKRKKKKRLHVNGQPWMMITDSFTIFKFKRWGQNYWAELFIASTPVSRILALTLSCFISSLFVFAVAGWLVHLVVFFGGDQTSFSWKHANMLKQHCVTTAALHPV